jgi:hypothetical protein
MKCFLSEILRWIRPDRKCEYFIMDISSLPVLAESSTELLQDMQNLHLQGTIVRTARQSLPTADAGLIDP